MKYDETDRCVFLLGVSNEEVIEAAKEIRRLGAASIAPITLHLYSNAYESCDPHILKYLAETINKVYAPVRVISHFGEKNEPD